MDKEITLRKASIKDTQTVFNLILELAEHEKSPNKVIATPDNLKDYLFVDNAIFEVVLAEMNHHAVGFALFFQNFSTVLGRPGIFIEALFVKAEYQRKGIGRQLMAYIANYANKRDFLRVEWAVFEWNTSAIEFYEKIGGQLNQTLKIFRLPKENIATLI